MASRRSIWSIACVLLLMPLAIGGCASKFSRSELVAHLRSVGGAHKGVRVIPIHADTQMEAFARLAEARSEPTASLSRDLGQQLRTARSRRVTFVVGGPYSDLADQIVRNALEFNQATELPGLTLVFVAPDPPSDTLVQAVASRRGRLFHNKLEPKPKP